MKKILLPLLGLVAVVAACVPSVNPFYTDKDIVTDARLAGVWSEDGNKDRAVSWSFTANTNRAYAVSLTDDEKKAGNFEGYLFKLENGFFLDLTPTECSYATNQAPLVGCAMIPGHLLLRVTFTGKQLGLAVCNPDWLKKFLEKNPGAIAHRDLDGGIILTAETGALQKFVLKHLGKDELFGDGTSYRRPEAAAPSK